MPYHDTIRYDEEVLCYLRTTAQISNDRKISVPSGLLIILLTEFNIPGDFKTQNIQCNTDIRELSGPEKKSLVSGFSLFCLGNTGSNLGLERIALISGSLIYGLHCISTGKKIVWYQTSKQKMPDYFKNKHSKFMLLLRFEHWPVAFVTNIFNLSLVANYLTCWACFIFT